MIAVRLPVFRWQLQLRAINLPCISIRTRIVTRYDVLQTARRGYTSYKFEHIPDEPMAFVAGLSDSDRQKLKECLQNYSSLNEAAEQVEKPNRSQKILGSYVIYVIPYTVYLQLCVKLPFLLLDLVSLTTSS